MKSDISVRAKLLTFAFGLSRRLSWATEDIFSRFRKPSEQFWLKQRIMMARRESLYTATVAVAKFLSESAQDGFREEPIADPHLLLSKPSYAFRRAAYSTGLIEIKAERNRWLSREYRLTDIKIPAGHPARHDVDARKLFYTVAGEVMTRYFPSETWIAVLDNKGLIRKIGTSTTRMINSKETNPPGDLVRSPHYRSATDTRATVSASSSRAV